METTIRERLGKRKEQQGYLPSAAFTDQTRAVLRKEMQQKSSGSLFKNLRWLYFPLLIAIIVAGIVFLRPNGQQGQGGSWQIISLVEAAEKIQARLAVIITPDSIFHSRRTEIITDEHGAVTFYATYDSYEDKKSYARVRNIATYRDARGNVVSTRYQINDGDFDWDYDTSEHLLIKTKYIYNKLGDKDISLGVHEVIFMQELLDSIRSDPGSSDIVAEEKDGKVKITHMSEDVEHRKSRHEYYFDAATYTPLEERVQYLSGDKVTGESVTTWEALEALDRTSENVSRLFRFDIALPSEDPKLRIIEKEYRVGPLVPSDFVFTPLPESDTPTTETRQPMPSVSDNQQEGN